MFNFFRTLLLFSFLAAGSALAAVQPFDQATFDRLQAENKPILIMIHADWCPTCKAQEPIVAELLATEEFKPITALQVDFDRQKDVVRAFKVSMQSTLIVFRGGKEVGRSTGDTHKDRIAALLKKAL